MSDETRDVVLEIKSDGDNLGLIADLYDHATGEMYDTTAREFADTGHVTVDGATPLGKDTHRFEVAATRTDALTVYLSERFSGGRYGVTVEANGETLFEADYALDQLGIALPEDA